jgi:hypothetical protein
MKFPYGFLILLFANVCLFAQAPDTLWIKKYGGNNQDHGSFVQQTSDGGYILAGDTKSWGAGLNDAWLVKTNATGNVVWSQTFGGTEDDNASCVRQTGSGGYLLFAESVSFDNTYWKVWLIRTNESGDTTWTQKIGKNRHYFVQSGQEILDGYIFVGYTKASGAGQEDVWLVKTDLSGDTLWTETFGGSEKEVSECMDVTSDGGYIIAATTGSFGSYDCWLIRTDVTGDTVWTKRFGGDLDDQIYSVRQTSDHGFILAGGTQQPYGYHYYDLWLIKTNSFGDTVWTKTYGGAGNDYASSVQQTSDGGYIIGGATSTGAWIVKTDATGDTLWTKSIGFGAGICIQQTSDGGYILLAETFSTSTLTDVYLVKTAPDPTNIRQDSRIFIPEQFILEQNYPNPFNPITTIRFDLPKSAEVQLIVYDILGRKVATLVNKKMPPGIHEVEWNTANYGSGLYFYQLKAGNFSAVKKMLMVK